MSHKENKSPVVIAALYCFTTIKDPEALRQSLKDLTTENSIMGLFLVAHEGLNGTVAGTREAIDALNQFLTDDGRFETVNYKESYADEAPFYRMKIKVKPEIVTMGQGNVNVVGNTGQHITPEQWNELIQDPETILIDTRNDYEVEIGTFKGATNPNTVSFREFADFVEQELDPENKPKVAMFCTGGIRCEKASAWMRENGYDEVYQLEGGILNYLKETPKEESLWEGDCFVFDERVAVNHDLAPEERYGVCRGCRRPTTPEMRSHEVYEEGVCCPQCVDERTDEQKQAARERQKQMELAAQRGEIHIGPEALVQNRS